MTAVVRDGKLVESALAGVNTEKLDWNEKTALLAAINKSQNGGRLGAADVQAVAAARKKGL